MVSKINSITILELESIIMIQFDIDMGQAVIIFIFL